MRGPRRPAWRVLLVPALLAVATAAGLAAGLLGDGAADLAAWAGLALPLAALLVAWRNRPRRSGASAGNDPERRP